MTVAFRRGAYGVRLARTDADRAACQALRHARFLGRPGLDVDTHDAQCLHLMVADAGGLVATARVLQMESGAALGQSYAGARYDLARLGAFPAPVLELGRLCVDPRAQGPDVMRLIWAALAQMVDAVQAGLLIGCTSFPGTDPAPWRGAFGYLARRHLAPARWAPGVGSPEVVALAEVGRPAALPAMPALLRSYLALGGWVSDHAVVDRQMGTLHVLTALEIAAIPPRRAAALRGLTGAD